MGDDFREEYTDLKKHGIPILRSRMHPFWLFPVAPFLAFSG